MWRLRRVVFVVSVFLASTTPALAASDPLWSFIAEQVSVLPGENSHAFADGTDGDVRTVAQAAVDVRAGRVGEARAAVAPLGYEVVDLPGSYLALRERTPCKRCWGTYVVNRSPSARNVFVEVPHPKHDKQTPEFGVEAFRALNATWFLMAGTHRYANGSPSDPCVGVVSDMARNDHSLFMAIHRSAKASDWVLQYHGFKVDKSHPDVVLSNGSKIPPAELTVLRQQLEKRGISAGVFDGTKWTDYGATCNPQGKYTRKIHGHFVHMEHQPGVRVNIAKRSAAVDAVRAAFFS